jgi:hypothetical protein
MKLKTPIGHWNQSDSSSSIKKSLEKIHKNVSLDENKNKVLNKNIPFTEGLNRVYKDDSSHGWHFN